MAAITQDQLNNASIDADTLSDVVNGGEDETVTTRMGQQIPTLAKAVKDAAEDLAGRDVGSSAAALINDKINQYRVVMLGQVVVDYAAQVIRYPAMEVMRNGTPLKTVLPASYTVSGAALADFPIPTSANTRLFHYLDIAAIGTLTASPVKSATAAAVPAPAPNIVPLGQSSGLDYTPAEGVTVLPSRVAARLDDLTLAGGDVIYDARGLLARDGVAMAYVPLRLVYRLLGTSASPVAGNAESSLMPGYTSFAVDASPAGIRNTIWYDPAANMFQPANGGAQIVPTGKAQWIAIASFWRNGVSGHHGVRVIDYAASLGENVSEIGRVMINAPRKWGGGGSTAHSAQPLSALDQASRDFFTALGLTSGVKRAPGESVVVGDDLSNVRRGSRVAIRLYIHSPSGAWPAAVIAYLRKSGPADNVASLAMTLEAQWTPNVRSYVANIATTLDKDVDHFWAGPTAGIGGSDLSVWGEQVYAGPRQVLGIYYRDYPTSAGAEAGEDSPESANLEWLHRFKSGLQRIDDGEDLLLSLGVIGDSWVYRNMWRWRVARRLQALYGEGGSGFLGFADQNGIATAAAEDGLSPDGQSNDRKFNISATAGSWAATPGYVAPTANCAELVSGAAASVLRIIATGAQINTRIALLYRPLANTSVRYRWTFDAGDGSGVVVGAWAALALSAGYVAVLAGVPPVGSWTLEIEDTGSARCALTGLAMRKNSGVLVHAAGVPGSTSSQWAAVAATAGFRAHWAELGCDTALISHGTNDQTAQTEPSIVADNFAAIVAGVRAAIPNAGDAPTDAFYVAPAENLRTNNVVPMSAYAQALYAASVEDGAAFLDLDPVMSREAAWWADTIHPTGRIGGAAIGRAVLEALDR